METPRDDPFAGRRPDIDYPCTWGFRILGEDEAAIRDAVRAVMGTLEHDLRFGNRTEQGNFCSLHLKVVVQDEAHRNDIFAALSAHPTIRFVL